MSWWAYLRDADGNVLPVDNHSEGGTYVLGGVGEAELNVTYNYGAEFRRAWPEELEGSGALRLMLDGRTGSETAPLLMDAVAKLGTERDPDYWTSTPGNAGTALATLAKWADMHPDGIWSIS